MNNQHLLDSFLETVLEPDKETISFDATTKCKKCNTGILCKCGACVCDKPIQQDIF
jgi:hypothetical protein